MIVVKENHAFDNYFGRFPGADGDPNLPLASDPPTSDHPHDHAAWLNRATGAAREQYDQPNIPNYWRYAQQYTLCDRYFTEVAGPSTPNHLMLIAADSPIINNPHYRDPIKQQPPFDIPSLPANLEKAGLTWRNYGGYAHGYITALKSSPNNSDRRSICQRCGRRQPAGGLLALRPDWPQRSSRRIGQCRAEMDRPAGRRHRAGRAVVDHGRLHHLGRLGRLV